ncbi:MAG: hypothetical protein Q8L53_05980 [Aestuariivirga sp.]|nr:hypothetical protein [Aestuariivirga sp.]
MWKKLRLPVSLALGLLALAPLAQARASHANPDHYIFIPPRSDISCQQARLLLKKDGYRVAKTLRCGGNYHLFRAERSGRGMIVQVMTAHGKKMIDARSGSKGLRWRMASY